MKDTSCQRCINRIPYHEANLDVKNECSFKFCIHHDINLEKNIAAVVLSDLDGLRDYFEFRG